MERGFGLNIVVFQGLAVLQLLASEDQTLLVRRDALLLVHCALDSLDGVAGVDVERDSLASQGLDEDLHGAFSYQWRDFDGSGGSWGSIWGCHVGSV